MDNTIVIQQFWNIEKQLIALLCIELLNNVLKLSVNRDIPYQK
ncbi:hypothetical protein rpr22_0129 [Rickettsia prowazekii str. Rp22]|uniref:Uncharacterized protein n=1 Tax=Rickettsia prowazekii (strain Rp22) TaxID=449216 RepID=D5AW47_RICPP|nr:hypothetical protein rpr22_0129 [Rickettsia prowazekii str. Rp22]